MIDKEKIRAEVLRLKDDVGIGLSAYDMGTENGAFETCEKILQFIDSLPEEPVNEDLEKAERDYINSDAVKPENMLFAFGDFITGANWQKQQMMKDAINEEVVGVFGAEVIIINKPENTEIGDKVKVIIIKEEEK